MGGGSGLPGLLEVGVNWPEHASFQKKAISSHVTMYRFSSNLVPLFKIKAFSSYNAHSF